MPGRLLTSFGAALAAVVIFMIARLDGLGHSDRGFVAVLEIPPVVSAQTAVRVQTVKDMKGKK
jgi:hypothetical protein